MLLHTYIHSNWQNIRIGMPLNEQFHRTMSKLDEIEMFMIDYRDITMEYYNNYDASGEVANH